MIQFVLTTDFIWRLLFFLKVRVSNCCVQWLHLTGNAFMAFPTAERRNFPLCSELSPSKLHSLSIFFITKTFPWIKSVQKIGKKISHPPFSIQLNVSITILPSCAFFPQRFIAQKLAPPTMSCDQGTGLSLTLLLRSLESSKAASTPLFLPEELFRMTEPQTAGHRTPLFLGQEEDSSFKLGYLSISALWAYLSDRNTAHSVTMNLLNFI